MDMSKLTASAPASAPAAPACVSDEATNGRLLRPKATRETLALALAALLAARTLLCLWGFSALHVPSI